MIDPESEKLGQRSDVGAKPKKRPYQKPSFKWERVFETSALTCGKVGTTTPECKFNRKSNLN